MADEALIDRLYDIVNSITLLGGEQERTSITPGVLVADANPVDLPTGYIKIVNPRDGTYVPCLTINGLVVEDNDLVNTLFTRGTEPIALSQSANSPSNTLKVSEIWDSDFDAVAMQSNADGDIGIGTATIPHGGVGVAKFAIEGPNASVAGPHVQITTDSDDHPVRQHLHWQHDNVADNYDAYFDGSDWKSSDVGSNFQIYKVNDVFRIRYDSAVAQGGTVTWNEGISLNTSGQVGINTAVMNEKLQVNGSVSITNAFSSTNKYILEREGRLQFTATGFGDRAWIGSDNANQITVTTGSATTAAIFGPTTYLTIGSGAVSITSRLFINNNAALTYGFTAETGSAGRGFQVITPDFVATTTGSVLSMNMGAGSGNTNSNVDAFTAGKSASGDLVLQSISGGNVGIGIAPQGKLHTYDAISGFLKWEYDGLDATVRTAIPNGTGDVLYRLHASYVLRDSAAAVASGTTDVSNSASVNLVVGTNTVRLRVNADGSCDVARTAGTDTIKVNLVLTWL